MKGGISSRRWNYRTAQLYSDGMGCFYWSGMSRQYLSIWEWRDRVVLDASLGGKTRVRVRAGRQEVA